jgi:ankyrin repeat protein
MEVVMSEPTSSLPSRPDLDQLKKQAKELRASGAHRTLAEAQLALARRHGFASWTKLKRAVELATLRRLIEEGDAAAARVLVASSPGLAKATFDDGSTPLHLAAGENRPALVEALVEHGAPLHAAYGKSAHTALSWALTCWSYGAAEKLVALGVEPDLFCAAGLGDLDRVRAFWPGGSLRRHPSRTGSSRYTDAGAPLPRPPRRDTDQVSDALYLACRCNRPEVARWLLDHGADPNWCGYAGASCLAWAEFSGNLDLCALLRARGGSDDVLDQQYRATPRVFPLMVFSGWGFPRLLLERLTADRTLAALTGGRGTLLHAAAEGGQEAAARILVHFGADRGARDPEGRTPAELAQARGHATLAALLSP